VVDDPRRLPSTKVRVSVRAERSGSIAQVDGLALARLALHLGAGRDRAEDAIDHAVGIEIHAKVGDRVKKGERLATLHVRKKSQSTAQSTLAAFTIKRGLVERPPLFIGRAIS
jgi:pyrimidine-nucleoside phosphorylase